MQGTSTQSQAQHYCSGYGEYGSASWDLTQGRVGASGTGSMGGYGGSVDAVDEFRLLGPDASQSVTIRVVLVINGQVCNSAPGACCYGAAQGYVRSADGTQDVFSVPGDPEYSCASATDSVEVVLSVVPGQPFTVGYGVSGGGVEGGSGSAAGALHFSDLPPGAGIVSCHGFQQDLATPARRGSWGVLKIRYR